MNSPHKLTFRMAMAVLAFVPLAIVASCQHTARTPQAEVFATLKAAGAGIDSYRSSYEAAAQSGTITPAQKHDCDVRFNQANEALIAAAKAARDGMNAQTPPEVQAAVKSFVDLVVLLVPPKQLPPRST